MRPGAPLVGLLLFAATAVFAAQRAEAYVCTPVSDASGTPVSPAVTQVWAQRCVPYFINRNNSLLSGDARRQLLRQSFDQWSSPNCTDLELFDAGYTNDGAEFDPNRSDNQNVITALENPQEAAAFFPDNNMVALTITAFSTRSGEIFDADLVVNAASFTFEDVSNPAACRTREPAPFDLRSILTHEIGHIIGFDHPDAPEATMYFQAPPCEIKKRDLAQDDLDGLCEVYAAGQPPRTCAEPRIAYDDVDGVERFRNQCEKAQGLGGSSCSCDAAGAPAGEAAWLTGLGLLSLALARRRRRALGGRL